MADRSPDDEEPAWLSTEETRRDPEELPAEIREEVPDWEDPYLDRVSDRLLYSFDLEKDRRLRGERFDLYAEMRMRTQRQFFHPALRYANHETREYVFVRRSDRPSPPELERLRGLGHDLADDWVEADEEHYRTDFTFVLVAETIPESVSAYVDGFRDRTLLKWGYYGHYEVNFVVVTPREQDAVASEAAEIADAFVLWEEVEPPEEGILSRFAKRFWT
ncbi:hypothetical protein [Natrialbaceae archaeon AArc-T1-2]|uniref:hypothetical protein n=1 Tax=Natrialbaceae archaeon AArc-T1-2 TaxID=3053904 RepID=UPI00255B2AE0|nr:hypothetical protein [Natrialbaceae archaeon AArc-T1-2]WIV68130.1 hypothetical protein QQ977_05215 [Natrialbaceae archaeon AArc-T1-2]